MEKSTTYSTSLSVANLGQIHCINGAISTLESLTCLQFRLRMNERDYVIFSARQGVGYSNAIGQIGGRPMLERGPGCEDQMTIFHEICHALRMWHEQSRPHDCDNYVQILKNNINGNECTWSVYEAKQILH